MTESEMLAEAESIACAEDYDSYGDKIRDIARLVRDFASAALRERDAAWLAAFLGSHLHSQLTNREGLWRECKDCAPLRALLEEAGQ